MTLTVGIVSPGEMGHAVGRLLGANGARVVTSLAGRSERTARLAASAGIEDLGDLASLMSEADMVISIVEPASALDLSRTLADAMRAADRTPLFVDANAVSPDTVREISAVIAEAGGDTVDASIIGMPPRDFGTTRFYASGPSVARFLELRSFGLDVRSLGAEIGSASAIKMSFAAVTKGFTAVATGALIVAYRNGVMEPLLDELRHAQPELLAKAEFFVPSMPPKSRRWVGEMEEIADSFLRAGLPRELFQAVAQLYQLIGATPMALVPPEERPTDQTVEAVIRALASDTLDH